MEQTHIKSFGLRLVLARHVIIPRDLLFNGDKELQILILSYLETLLGLSGRLVPLIRPRTQTIVYSKN
nr:MAG TPA: hypothetical protein [Caudoviricetes sp.]